MCFFPVGGPRCNKILTLWGMKLERSVYVSFSLINWLVLGKFLKPVDLSIELEELTELRTLNDKGSYVGNTVISVGSRVRENLCGLKIHAENRLSNLHV